MIPTKRNNVSPCFGSRDAHRNRHRFTARPRVPNLLSPRVNLQQRFRQLDLFRIVQGTHGAGFNPPYHRGRNIRIVIPEQAGADAHNRHVQ